MTVLISFKELFHPPRPIIVTFDTAVDLLEQQKLARITKTALFVLATLAVFAIVTMSEAAVIIWPIFVPALMVAAIAGYMFKRINGQDKAFQGAIEDSARTSVVKEELTQLICHRSCKTLSPQEINQTFKNIELILGDSVFPQTFKTKVLDLHQHAEGEQTLFEASQAQKQPLTLSFKREWTDYGKYGLSSHKRAIDLELKEDKEDFVVLNCLYEEIIEKPKEEPKSKEA